MTGSKLALVLVPGLLLVGVAGVGLGVRYRDEILKLATGREVVAAASPAAPATQPQADDKVLYICGMHPSVIRDKPGFCPICGMALTATHVHGGNASASTVQIDPVTVQNMGIRTAPVIEGEIRQTLRAVGTLSEPEQNHRDINLRVSGWIQKLIANQEGMMIAQGDPLFELYSPEITAAADELIAARKAFATVDANADPVLKRSSETVLAAGKRKLELMGLSAAQIDEIAKLDKAPPSVTISSPMKGHIAEKMVVEGSSVRAGEKLMEIADRSTMWLQLQIYEQQLGQVHAGLKVRAKIAAFPEKVFEGTVDFIYPHLDTATRTAMVRVVLENPGHALHENMYATADVEVPEQARSLLVPREAVIDTGRRQVVFVAESDGHFTARDVSVGKSGRLSPSEPEMVQIAYGLNAGEKVVTSGQFLLDSESRMQEAQLKFAKIGGETGGDQSTGGMGDDAVSAQATPSRNTEPNAHVAAVIQAYLPLSAFLGAPQADTNPVDVKALLKAANELASDEDAALKQAGQGLVAAVKAVDGQPIDQQRAKFKNLSKQVVALSKTQILAPSLGKLYAFRCTMDNSEWLQTTASPATPFFPVGMKTCGEVTQAITPKPATQPEVGK